MTQDQAREILETAAADPTFTVGKLIERVKTDKEALQAKIEVGEDITILDAIVALIIFDNPGFEEDYKKVHYKNTGSGKNAFSRNGINAMLDIQDKNIRKDYWDWWVQSGYLHTIDFPITESTSVKDLIQEAVNFSYYCQTDKFAEKLNGNEPGGRFLDYFEEKKKKFQIGHTAVQDIAQMTITDAIETSTKKCVVFTGAPGTGKTYCVEKYVEGQGQMKNFDRKEYFVQFHSSYDYTDFVEGLRPIKINGKMEFERMDGIFKAFCRKVVKQGGETPYYFVIDEINRADLGRVFGELMYCFEKRGEEHSIATQYANLDTYDKDGNRLKDKNGNFTRDGCFDGGFFIPDNVIIIGTMNDIDRSVETFDFALRRRFDWVEIDANKVMFHTLRSMKEITGEVTEELVKRIKNMNEVIAHGPGLSPAFAIGPSYFSGYDGTEKKLQDIWEHNIEPILKEYMRGRQGADKFIGNCKAALFPNG